VKFESTTMGRMAYVVDSRIGFHVKALAAVMAEVLPGKHSGSHRHLYDEINYVLSGRGKVISLAFGEPLTPTRRENGDAVAAELRERMHTLLDEVRRRYPQRPVGEDRWWLPAAMGGTAPTPQEAAGMDAAEAPADGAAAD